MKPFSAVTRRFAITLMQNLALSNIIWAFVIPTCLLLPHILYTGFIISVVYTTVSTFAEQGLDGIMKIVILLVEANVYYLMTLIIYASQYVINIVFYTFYYGFCGFVLLRLFVAYIQLTLDTGLVHDVYALLRD